jgi:hypothetical protein
VFLSFGFRYHRCAMQIDGSTEAAENVLACLLKTWKLSALDQRQRRRWAL